MYKERRRVLDGENMKDSVIHMMEETIADYVNQCASEDAAPEEWDMDTLNAELRPIIPFGKIELTQEEIQAGKPEMLTKRLQDEAVELYAHKETEFEDYDLREIERIILLKVIDRKWMDHIDDMDQLREGIGMQAYGQRRSGSGIPHGRF